MKKQERLLFDPDTGKVVVEQITHKREISLDEFYANLSEGISAETPILPRGTRIWRMNPKASNSRRYLIIIEQEPGLMNLGFGNKDYGTLWAPNGAYHFNQRNCRSFRISMPWTYFWFECSTSYRVSNVGAFVSKKPIQSRDDWMMKAPFPNISGHTSGGFCTGTISVDQTDASGKVKPLGQLVLDTMASIHDSTFNYDYGCFFPKEVIEATYAHNAHVRTRTTMVGESQIHTLSQQSHGPSADSSKVASTLWPALFSTWEAMSKGRHQIATTWHYQRVFKLGDFLDNLSSRNVPTVSGEWI